MSSKAAAAKAKAWKSVELRDLSERFPATHVALGLEEGEPEKKTYKRRRITQNTGHLPDPKRVKRKATKKAQARRDTLIEQALTQTPHTHVSALEAVILASLSECESKNFVESAKPECLAAAGDILDRTARALLYPVIKDMIREESEDTVQLSRSFNDSDGEGGGGGKRGRGDRASESESEYAGTSE